METENKAPQELKAWSCLSLRRKCIGAGELKSILKGKKETIGKIMSCGIRWAASPKEMMISSHWDLSSSAKREILSSREALPGH